MFQMKSREEQSLNYSIPIPSEIRFHLKEKSITSPESSVVRRAVTLCNGGLRFLLWQTKGKLFKWHQVSFHLWKGMTSIKGEISRLKRDFLFSYSSCHVWSGVMRKPDGEDKILSKQINKMPIPHLIKLQAGSKHRFILIFSQIYGYSGSARHGRQNHIKAECITCLFLSLRNHFIAQFLKKRIMTASLSPKLCSLSIHKPDMIHFSDPDTTATHI